MKYLLLLIVFLVGCTSLDEGYVVGKRYSPEESRTEISYNVMLKIPTTTVVHYPERFYLTIRGVVDGDTITEEKLVYRETFYQYDIGDYLKF